MRWKTISFLLLGSLLAGCGSVAPKPKPIARGDLQEFQKSAARFNSVVTIPTFETTTNELAQTVATAIADGNAALDRMGRLSAAEVNFTNTVRALDDLGFQLAQVDNRLSLIQETSTNAGMRDMAAD
jgi:Zn-dependent oligopeptidase